MKGKRLPSLLAVIEAPGTVWTSVTVADRHGGGERSTVEVAAATALWYDSGSPPVPLRWVPVRDPREEGGFATHKPCYAPTRGRTGADPLLVRFALADGTDFSGSTAASRGGDAAAVDGEGDPAHDEARATGPVLAGDAAGRPAADGRGRGNHPPPVGVVARSPPDLRGRVGAGAPRALWAPETFRASSREADTVKVPRELLERLTEAICYAA